MAIKNHLLIEAFLYLGDTTENMADKPNLFSLLKPYWFFVAGLVVLAIISNGLNLVIPKIIARGIDAYTTGTLSFSRSSIQFAIVAVLIYLFSYLQSMLQTYAAERVARDLRRQLAAKISQQTFAFVQTVTSAKLLTNLTSDVDAVKLFISQAIVSIISSLFLIIGASTLLLVTNWRLALAVLVIIPVIAGTFFVIFTRIGALFKKSQGIIDQLNRVINESILGAALIRILNSQQSEYAKFLTVNAAAKETGLRILSLFVSLIPVIMFTANMAILIILALGGHFVITGRMTLGDLSAFNAYVSILIFPIILIGFMSNVIARATASYGRLSDVLTAADLVDQGTKEGKLRGEVAVQHISVTLNQHPILKDVSFTVAPGSKTAIIGPTAAGKTQLLCVLTGLLQPDTGTVLYDGVPLVDYQKQSFYQQVGLVFQDSIVFNLTLRENIAFSDTVTDTALTKAMATAELQDFIQSLPDGLDTIVSERGTSLSGGQKQRIMLARALAINPQILLLDDFTARVDALTEQKIITNISANYPGLTLISVTQKIAAVEHYDQIILLMEGEVLAHGTHQELLHSSPEYVQILKSQQSTSHYELPPQ